MKAEDSSELPDNGIPVIYVNIDESQGTIKDMLESPDHSDYCYGAISIDVPEGFHYADFPDLACESMENLAMSIRGRGNSTWMKSDKKPFKIKLDKKADVFGLGKNKHWVLVANKFDTSLLRDRITAWLSEQMNFEFTPRGVPVDLVFTGEEYGTHYMGSYYFSENVRVDENRLEIDELKEDDVDEPVITGGYLLQDSLQVRSGSPDIFFTKHHVDWATHTPSFDTEEDAALGDNEEGLVGGTLLEESFAGAELGDGYENHVQQTYIQNHIQRIEDLLYSEGTDYRELMDVESAAKYWLINIFPLNADAYITGSTYIYKKRDTDGVIGKLYWGPVWDFDYAWDNKADTTGFPVRHEWIKALFCDREEGGFVEEVRKQWIPMREAVVKLIEDGGLIDQYAAETKASAEQDYPVNHAEDDPEEFDYLLRVEQLKQWIRDRLAWVDENLDMLDTLAHRVILDVDGEIYDITYKAHGE
ncbi:MAG: CotH kinase family protein, partial [Solobacterium sp.]|nr:CotH kinase family protein [Solobacterium sp.]